MKRVLGCTFITILAMGCGAADEAAVDRDTTAASSSTEAPGRDNTQSASQDLAPGAQGAAVRAVYDYLARYGYFPSEKLAKAFPGFQPLVASTPSDTSVYGAELTEAVRLYQRNMGLETTGIVDAKTRDIMSEPRCSFPDGYGPGRHTAVVEDPDAPPTAELTSGGRGETVSSGSRTRSRRHSRARPSPPTFKTMSSPSGRSTSTSR
jgi:peptidoglycan hydrolase-like protein with peptidoglycan-binding domain